MRYFARKMETGNVFTIFHYRFNVRCCILFVFSVTTAVSVAVVPSVSLGLDQEMSMPDDSHVLKYFQVCNSFYNY